MQVTSEVKVHYIIGLMEILKLKTGESLGCNSESLLQLLEWNTQNPEDKTVFVEVLKNCDGC